MKLLLVKEDDLATTRLTADHRMVREPRRPVEKLDEKYHDRFDSDTLFYDAFYDETRGETICIGPSLWNLYDPMRSGTCLLETAGNKSPVPFYIADKIRVGTATVLAKTSPGDTLLFESQEIGTVRIKVGESRNGFFTDLRVMQTMVRYDQLQWIVDWAAFHARVHKVNGILIYNHRSANFTSEQLLEALSAVEGLEAAAVVDWNFKRGPRGVVKGPLRWGPDAKFCQHGGIEHARQNFLRNAEAVLLCDVDELVICGGDRTVFELAHESSYGYVQFDGLYVNGPKSLWDLPCAERRHSQATTRAKSSEYFCCPRKYAVIPKRLSPDLQWTIHDVPGLPAEKFYLPRIQFRHFRHLNENWLAPRGWLEGPCIEDNILARDYQKVGWSNDATASEAATAGLDQIVSRRA